MKNAVWSLFQPTNGGQRRFERQLLRWTSILLFALFLIAALVYYVGFRSAFYEQVERSNLGQVEQIGLSFETLLKQISNGIYRIPLYDTEILDLIRKSTRDPLFALDIVRKLDSLNNGNDYIYSSYLYVKRTGLVYSTETNSIRPLIESPSLDQILASRQGVISVSVPRLVDTIAGRKLLLSIICPIPLYSGDYEGLLVTNVDTLYLYSDILKKVKMGPNQKFLVFDDQGKIVFKRDDKTLLDAIGTKILPSPKPDPMAWLGRLTSVDDTVTSRFRSETLGWTFSLETTVRSSSVIWDRLYTFLVILIGLLGVGLTVLILIIRGSTRPIRNAYNQTLWSDFLGGVSRTGSTETDEKGLRRLLDVDHFRHSQLRLLLIHHHPESMETDEVYQAMTELKARLDQERSWLEYRLITINGSQTVLVLNGEELVSEQWLAALPEKLRQEFFISIGQPLELLAQLRNSYRDCALALNYRLSAPTSFMVWPRSPPPQAQPFLYPQELENQVLNNLLAGVSASCRLLLEQFFDLISSAWPLLSDGEIRAHCFRLQSAISAKLYLYPLSGQYDLASLIGNARSLSALRSGFCQMVENATTEIGERLHRKDSGQIQQVRDYLEAHYTEATFNLNSLADHLKINRNHLANLIKQHYGEGFSELTTHMRVKRAKILLAETSVSVEQMAHELGYSYANYFIRVFKRTEGITPGQFRERQQ